jgi:predicted transposase YdaD
LDESIVKTINHFTEQNILLDYLQEHTSEIRNMLFHEFNMDDALAVAKEEGVEEGRTEGREEERSYIKSLLQHGLSGEEFLKQMKAEYALS